MPPRRPGPTPNSQARAARIAAGLADLLDEVAPPQSPSAATGGPYRPAPSDTGRTPAPPPLPCPGCGGPLHIELRREVEIHSCTRCHGLWLDPGELQALVDEPAGPPATMAELRETMAPMTPPLQEVRYRKCPRCDNFMHRRNYGGISGIVIDECRTHGMFLDPGEFDAIETFIHMGGHQLQHTAQRAALQRELRTLESQNETARANRAAQPLTRLHWLGRLLDAWIWS